MPGDGEGKSLIIERRKSSFSWLRTDVSAAKRGQIRRGQKSQFCFLSERLRRILWT